MSTSHECFQSEDRKGFKQNTGVIISLCSRVNFILGASTHHVQNDSEIHRLYGQRDLSPALHNTQKKQLFPRGGLSLLKDR